jgi:hypothetical protein
VDLDPGQIVIMAHYLSIRDTATCGWAQCRHFCSGRYSPVTRSFRSIGFLLEWYRRIRENGTYVSSCRAPVLPYLVFKCVKIPSRKVHLPAPSFLSRGRCVVGGGSGLKSIRTSFFFLFPHTLHLAIFTLSSKRRESLLLLLTLSKKYCHFTS